MRVFNTIPQANLRDTAAAAQASEAAGYDALLSMENKHDPFLCHAIAAVSTSRIELGTNVAISFPRSPMVVANTCWDLQTASNGRFVLGLGPQIRPHNERRFSVPWTAPAPRMREYVQALRAIWRCWEAGEKLDFRGKHYTFTLMPPYFMPESTGQKMVPITLAAVGDNTLRLAGEVADGARLHPFCTRQYMEQAILPRLAEGMARTGRTRANFEITGGGFIATGADGEATARQMETVRGRIGFYGTTPAYWPVLDMHGLGDLGRELNQMSKQGKWNELASRVSDDVVHLFAAVGPYRDIAKRIEERFGGMSDAISLRPDSSVGGGDVPPGLIQDIQRVATPFQGYAAGW